MRSRSPVRTILKWGARIVGGAIGLVLVSVGVVYALSERRIREKFAVPAHPLAVADAPEVIERGRHLVTIRGCVGCHGPGLAGRVEIDDPLIGRLAGPNLTRGGRGAALTPTDWERAVRHGLRRDGTPLIIMPANEHNGLSDEDLAAIVAYVRSLPPDSTQQPATVAGPATRALFLAGEVKLLPAEGIDHERPHPPRVDAAPTRQYGAYLASMCTGCHGEGYSGGRIPGGPPEWKPASNITPAGIGKWSEADFVRAMRAGRRPDGSAIDSTSMPIRLLRQMSDVELAALYAYLRSLPPKEYGNR